MMLGLHYVIAPDHQYDQSRLIKAGVDYGKHPLVLEEHGDLCIIKAPGSTQWSAVGSTEYYPTEYHLVRVRMETANGAGAMDYRRGHYEKATVLMHIDEVLVTWTPGAKWRACLVDLRSIAARERS